MVSTGVLQSVLQKLEHVYSTELYKQEFDALKLFNDQVALVKTKTDGWLPYNRGKNRYKDILPYDDCRVKIPLLNGVLGSDYINASRITGPPGDAGYIAAQGPLTGTVFCFWRMIWYQNVSVVIMVCKLKEMGKDKCANYWGGSVGAVQKWGNFSVTLVSEEPRDSYVLRTLRITCKEITREVYQYQYLRWPDRDVPSESASLYRMLGVVREHSAPSAPLVVHCSAGCGRTGTVMAIDFIDTLIKQGKLTEQFDMFEVVQEMRAERVAICQTKPQYGFVYATAIHLLQKALTEQDSPDPLYTNIPLSSPRSDEKQRGESRKESSPHSNNPPAPPPKPAKPTRPTSVELTAKSPEVAAKPTRSFAAKTPDVAPKPSFAALLAPDAEDPVYATVNLRDKTATLIDLETGDDEEEVPQMPPPCQGSRPVSMFSGAPPTIRTPAPSHQGLSPSPSVPIGSGDYAYATSIGLGRDLRMNLARDDLDNKSELSLPRSDYTESSQPGQHSSEDDFDDRYETFGAVSLNKPTVEVDAKEKGKKFSLSSSSRKFRGKAIGFKGMITQMTEKSNLNFSLPNAPSSNMFQHTTSTFQDIQSMEFVSTFGQRTATPKGPREMPSHWLTT